MCQAICQYKADFVYIGPLKIDPEIVMVANFVKDSYLLLMADNCRMDEQSISVKFDFAYLCI